MDKFAYPAGCRPHIPTGHLAGNPICSFIVQSGTVGFDMAGGGRGTISSTPTFAMDGAIGPRIDGINAGSAGFTFSGKPTSAAGASFTFAGIFRMSAAYSGSTTPALLAYGASADTAGAYIRLTTTTGFLVFAAPAVGAATSNIALPLADPLFVCVSNGPTGTTCNFAVRNLRTGVLQTNTQSRIAALAGTGVVAALFSLTRGFSGGVNCGMVSSSYLSMADIAQWSEDPWAFWYDRG